MEININLNKKQSQAFKRLKDETTTEVLYGGAVYGGKTYLLAIWTITNCLTYPGYRALVGRTKLTQLRLTTLKTIFEVLNMMNLQPDVHYKYNGQLNVITFDNGSEIILKDLEQKPSDMNFDSLGSLEISGAAVDEASQLSRVAYDVIKTRIRYKLKEFGLKPKLLLTTNPSNNWIKSEFYEPFVKDTLEAHRCFIQSLPTDNPHITQDYLKTLKMLPERQRKRLLEGNWNYDDSDDNLFFFDTLNNMFNIKLDLGDKFYASLDVARFGSDKSILVISNGLMIEEIYEYSKIDTNSLYENVRERLLWYNIPNSRVVIDSDGVGGGVADRFNGCINFVNNATPLHKQNYTNLKSQCYVTLANKIKKGEIGINIKDVEKQDKIINELLNIKLKDVDKDNKVGIIPKELIKQLLGHSPDYADALAMLMYFHIEGIKKATGKYSIHII